MSDTNDPSSPSAGAPPTVSRRTALLELAGIAVMLAIPVGAAVATANPIPNPPSRKTLNFAPLADPAADQQELEAESETRRSGKKRRDDKQRRGEGESRRPSRDDEQRPGVTEQRASQP